jgi:hypothetical protein
VVLFVPFAQRLFHFAPVHADDLVLSVAAAPICLLWFEALKRIRQPAPQWVPFRRRDDVSADTGHAQERS